MQSDYKEIYPDQPIAEGYNSEQRELESPSFPQGEKPELSPNPGYGEDGKTKDATKLKTEKGEDVSKTFPEVKQEGIKVEREPVNFIGGLYANGKEVATKKDLNPLKVYHHNIYIEDNDKIINLHIVNKKSAPYTSDDFDTDEKLNNIIFASMNVRLLDMSADTPINMIVTSMSVNGEYLNIGTYLDAYEEVSISFNTLEQFDDTVTEL